MTSMATALLDIRQKFPRLLIDDIILDAKNQTLEIKGRIGEGLYKLSQVNEMPVPRRLKIRQAGIRRLHPGHCRCKTTGFRR